MTRRVILVCGPPGAGKTTWAKTTGLTIYDRDDPRWDTGGERAFRQAIARLAHDPNAHAVVIRSGPTHQARQKSAALIGATETKVIAPPLATCIERITNRKRLKQPIRTQIASAKSWWRRHQAEKLHTVTQKPSRWVI